VETAFRPPITGADAAVIATEWNEFATLDLAKVREALARPVLVDLRNLIDPDDAARAGAAGSHRYAADGGGWGDPAAWSP
jgi:UDPglucose 6-dehydrogenase